MEESTNISGVSYLPCKILGKKMNKVSLEYNNIVSVDIPWSNDIFDLYLIINFPVHYSSANTDFHSYVDYFGLKFIEKIVISCGQPDNNNIIEEISRIQLINNIKDRYADNFDFFAEKYNWGKKAQNNRRNNVSPNNILCPSIQTLLPLPFDILNFETVGDIFTEFENNILNIQFYFCDFYQISISNITFVFSKFNLTLFDLVIFKKTFESNLPFINFFGNLHYIENKKKLSNTRSKCFEDMNSNENRLNTFTFNNKYIIKSCQMKIFCHNNLMSKSNIFYGSSIEESCQNWLNTLIWINTIPPPVASPPLHNKYYCESEDDDQEKNDYNQFILSEYILYDLKTNKFNRPYNGIVITVIDCKSLLLNVNGHEIILDLNIEFKKINNIVAININNLFDNQATMSITNSAVNILMFKRIHLRIALVPYTPSYVRSIAVSPPYINNWHNLIGGVCCRPYSIYIYGFSFSNTIFNTSYYSLDDIYYLLSLPIRNSNVNSFMLTKFCIYNDPLFCFNNFADEKKQPIDFDYLFIYNNANKKIAVIDNPTLKMVDTSTLSKQDSNLFESISLYLGGLDDVRFVRYFFRNKRKKTKYLTNSNFLCTLLLKYTTTTTDDEDQFKILN